VRKLENEVVLSVDINNFAKSIFAKGNTHGLPENYCKRKTSKLRGLGLFYKERFYNNCKISCYLHNRTSTIM